MYGSVCEEIAGVNATSLGLLGEMQLLQKKTELLLSQRGRD